MSFWSGEKLEKELKNRIEPFDAGRIDCASYTLRVGPEVYVTPSDEAPEPSQRTKQKLECGQAFTIPPGQFALILTEEQVKVPACAIAFISIKAKIKLRGLVNISGFHVDPGYSGRLIFSVLNAGPSVIHLARGQEMFLIWYADLNQPPTKTYDRGFTTLHTNYISNISDTMPSLQRLSKEVRRNSDVIGKLSNDSEKLHEIDKTLGTHKWILGVFVALLICVGGALIGDWVDSLSSQPTSPYK